MGLSSKENDAARQTLNRTEMDHYDLGLSGKPAVEVALSLFALVCGAATGAWCVYCVHKFLRSASEANLRLTALLQRRRLHTMSSDEGRELFELSPIADKRTAYQFLFDDCGWKPTAIAVAVLSVQVSMYIILYSFALDDAAQECEEYVRDGETGELTLRSERGSGTRIEQLGYVRLALELSSAAV
jgi:hypothetical protein